MVIRKAVLGDSRRLTEICRSSFGESLLWQGMKFLGWRWWYAVIRSASAETWVCSQQADVLGFIILITDSIGWKRQRYWRDMQCLTAAMCLIVSPALFFRHVWERIIKKKVQVQSRNRMDKKPANCEAIETWVGLLAIAPEERGKSLARQMLEFCEKRTLELGKNIVKLVVLPENSGAIKFYERCGYLYSGSGPSGLFYYKKLGKAST